LSTKKFAKADQRPFFDIYPNDRAPVKKVHATVSAKKEKKGRLL
jgi:hypothetical protein